MKPDYDGGSIVNLMASIGARFGAKTGYPSLRTLGSGELRGKTILIVIDGLGYEFLKRYGKGTFLERHLRGPMTSVFPPTTSAAMTAFYTGVAPQQHGYTGWFVHLKEAGGIHAVLPFVPWAGGAMIAERGFSSAKLIGERPFADRIGVKSAIVQPSYIINSDYSIYVAGKAKQYGAKREGKEKGLRNLFAQAKKALKTADYVLAYWDWLDHLEHDHGYDHPAVRRHFLAIDRELARFASSVEDTTILVTADHGHMIARKTIYLDQHPALADCLSLPLAGEPRAAYCYVRPSKVGDFLRYTKKTLGRYCDVKESDAMMREGWYGKGNRHAMLHHRVGDYIILMKDGAVFFDKPNGKRTGDRGNHGGISEEEMLVPLVVMHQAVGTRPSTRRVRRSS